MLATKQNRAPPSAFQNQPQGRPRASLDDAGNRESKQFSRPPSSQSFYSGQTPNTDESLISNHASRSPTANNNNPITSPPRRKASLSNTKVGPQILPPIANRKMHQNPPASLGRQIPPTTAQTQTPHLLQRSVANQDLQLANINGNMPMIGAPSSQTNMQSGLQDTQGTPISDRGIDLPPEFALFQVSYSQFHYVLYLDESSANLSLARLIFSRSDSAPPRKSLPLFTKIGLNGFSTCGRRDVIHLTNPIFHMIALSFPISIYLRFSYGMMT